MCDFLVLFCVALGVSFQELGIGGVLGLLWFRKRLPPSCTKFIEMVLMVTADHGPAVAGKTKPKFKSITLSRPC